jgi:hypothetical protein
LNKLKILKGLDKEKKRRRARSEGKEGRRSVNGEVRVQIHKVQEINKRHAMHEGSGKEERRERHGRADITRDIRYMTSMRCTRDRRSIRSTRDMRSMR